MVFAEVLEATGFPSKVRPIPVSLALNPTPLTVREVPGDPLVLLREIAGLVLKLILAMELAWVEVPEASIVCDPLADGGMMKLMLQLPVAPAVIPDSTISPSNVTAIPLSADLNPPPDTATEVPGGPLVLDTEITAPVAKLIVETVVVEFPTAPTV